MSVCTLASSSVTKIYGGAPVLDHVSLSIGGGTLALLTGVNGSGKTTLLNCMSGFDRAYTGSVSLGDHRLDSCSADARARLGVVRTFQTPHLFGDLTVADHLALGVVAPNGVLRGLFQRWRRPLLEEVVTGLGLHSLLPRRCDALSYGEMKLVNLARALSSAATVLLLDEPLASLHRDRRQLVVASIAQRVQRGAAALVVEHDWSDFRGEAAVRYNLVNGRLAQVEV